jgi:hypothetical protein
MSSEPVRNSVEGLQLCPRGRTDHEACFAPFRYCPVEGCGRIGPVPESRNDLLRAFKAAFQAGDSTAAADLILRLEAVDPDAAEAIGAMLDA